MIIFQAFGWIKRRIPWRPWDTESRKPAMLHTDGTKASASRFSKATRRALFARRFGSLYSCRPLYLDTGRCNATFAESLDRRKVFAEMLECKWRECQLYGNSASLNRG
eukprot:gb/GEZJ01009070.1/.p3 GENE.gb/GEZJ01009070.1/~~gb/GEZJ01009070.1/.p3  ORF type:complete len:108 (-),score=3.93 gb/GEZJ01009070.1/:100-423(-)